MNIIQKIDEQIRHHTGFIDSAIGERRANIVRDSFGLGLLAEVIEAIAEAVLQCYSPLFAFPATLAGGLVIDVFFFSVAALIFQSVLGRLLFHSPAREGVKA